MTGGSFPASAEEQERFVQQLLARRYGRVEIPTRPGLVALMTAVALLGVSGVTTRIDERLAPVLWGVAALATVVALVQRKSAATRRDPLSGLTRISHHPPATTAKLRVPSGCAPSAVLSGLKARFRAAPVRAPRIHGHFGALAAKSGEKSGLVGEGGAEIAKGLRTPNPDRDSAPGERVLERAPAGGRIRREVRYAGGVAQLVWGLSVVTTALVSTLLPGMSPLTGVYVGWISALMVVGCLMIGRSVRDMTSLSPAVEVILTNQRLLFTEAGGAAVSLPLVQIRNTPVVVDRVDGTATLGVELRSLPAVAPLPVKALWGVDVMTPGDARRWAQQIVDARRARDSEPR